MYTQNMKKYTWFIGIAVLVLIFIGIAVLHKKSLQNSKAPTQQNDQASQNQQANSSASPKAVSTKTQGQLYTDAVNTYQYRIQFTSCHGSVSGSAGVANGGTLVIKKGVKFMIDNRDPLAHTFAFNGQSYRVGAYSFAIVSAIRTGIYPLTCDGGGGAYLNVEG